MRGEEDSEREDQGKAASADASAEESCAAEVRRMCACLEVSLVCNVDWRKPFQ